MLISLNCLDEAKPGSKWQSVFHKSWPFYKEWFLMEGAAMRPGYLTSSTELQKYMPELMPVYHELCRLAGGDDLSARYLSMYCPPPYLASCSQLAWTAEEPMLVRNYDYNPALFEGAMLRTNWLQPVVGMSDCNWGVLDGINASGLAISLAFGGKKARGVGFGIPLIIRYLLETCHSVKEACEKLMHLPVHMAYNITMVDMHYNYSTVYVGPNQTPIISADRAATNHQQVVEWQNYALLTSSQERIEALINYMNVPNQSQQRLIEAFSQPPLFVYKPENNFVTLYTTVYRPLRNSVLVKWEGNEFYQSVHDFKEVTLYKKFKKMNLD